MRNGYIFVHPQKVDRAVSGSSTGGAVVSDANLMAFYGTTAASLGTDADNFQCCYRLYYTGTGPATDCKAAINVETTALAGNLIKHRVFYRGPTADPDSGVTDSTVNSDISWNTDFLLAA